MRLLRTTKYTLSSYVTDVEDGWLEVDCSKYVEMFLREVPPAHYNELPKSSTSGLTSLAKDYYSVLIPAHDYKLMFSMFVIDNIY